MTIDEIKQIKVGRKALAFLLGYHENHINYLVANEGAPKEDERNSYSLYDFLRWYVDYKNKKHEEEILRIKNDKPQDQLASVSAKIKELQLRKQNGELVDKKDVEAEWQNGLHIIITELDGFSIKAVPELLGITDPKELKIKLEDLIIKLKTRIAEQGLHSTGKPLSTD